MGHFSKFEKIIESDGQRTFKRFYVDKNGDIDIGWQ